tara:strand:- start:949 stop:1851 length:903 start_codon:yes stop_codon:yes gene_type:complete
MRYSKELVIGLTTFATVVCFIWGYNFLRGKNVFTQKRDYYAFYENVHGLQVGQPVTINGFKIGQVTAISFDYSFNGPLLVSFNISKAIEFTKDTKIRIYDMDIMGSKGLQVEIGTSKLMAVPGDTLSGDIKSSLTDQVTKQLFPLKEGTEKLVSVLDSTLRSITNLADKASLMIETNHSSLTNVVSNIDTLSGVFNAQRSKINSILSNLDRFSNDLAKANVNDAVANLNKTLNNLNGIVSDVNSGDGTLGKLLKKDDLYIELNRTIGALDLLLEDMRKDPKRYVHFSLFGRKNAPVDTLN